MKKKRKYINTFNAKRKRTTFFTVQGGKLQFCYVRFSTLTILIVQQFVSIFYLSSLEYFFSQKGTQEQKPPSPCALPKYSKFCYYVIISSSQFLRHLITSFFIDFAPLWCFPILPLLSEINSCLRTLF